LGFSTVTASILSLPTVALPLGTLMSFGSNY
jgi:hypothetical protein